MNVLLRATEKMLSLNRATGYGVTKIPNVTLSSAFHYECSSVSYSTWPFGVLKMLRANLIICSWG